MSALVFAVFIRLRRLKCTRPAQDGALAPQPELIGNIDEVTDVRLVGAPGRPGAVAVATNAPAIRLFDLKTLACTATLRGHSEAVLALDALLARCRPQMQPHSCGVRVIFRVSGLCQFCDFAAARQKPPFCA